MQPCSFYLFPIFHCSLFGLQLTIIFANVHFCLIAAAWMYKVKCKNTQNDISLNTPYCAQMMYRGFFLLQKLDFQMYNNHKSYIKYIFQ